jgi:hypothetical protein
MDETIYDVIARRTQDATNQQEAARALGVSETLYSLIISRKRPVSKRLALQLGYTVRRVTVYERLPAPDAAGVDFANDAASVEPYGTTLHPKRAGTNERLL